MQYLIIGMFIIIFFLVLTILFMRGIHKRELVKQQEAHIAEKQFIAEKHAQTNEIKESMETGCNRDDFNQSLNIMDTLKKKK